MNIVRYILGTLVVALCTACMASGDAERITAEAAKARIQQNPSAVILDVRTAEEYRAGHIKGAVLLPLDRLADEAEAVLADKNAEILIYCRSGRRSAEAGTILASLGYTKLYDFGGIMFWPYDIEKDG